MSEQISFSNDDRGGEVEQREEMLAESSEGIKATIIQDLSFSSEVEKETRSYETETIEPSGATIEEEPEIIDGQEVLVKYLTFEYKHSSKQEIKTRIEMESFYLNGAGVILLSPSIIGFDDFTKMLYPKEIKEARNTRFELFKKGVSKIGSSGYFEFIMGNGESLKLATGVNIIFGLSGTGKTSLALKMQSLSNRICYLNFYEPDELSIRSPYELLAMLNFCLGSPDTDIVIIDSIRYFIYSDSAKGSTMPGGISSNAFNMLSSLSSMLSWLDKTVVFVFNPLAGENDLNLVDKLLQANNGSVSSMIRALPNGYEVQGRIDMDRRNKKLFELDDLSSYAGYSEAKKTDSTHFQGYSRDITESNEENNIKKVSGVKDMGSDREKNIGKIIRGGLFGC